MGSAWPNARQKLLKSSGKKAFPLLLPEPKIFVSTAVIESKEQEAAWIDPDNHNQGELLFILKPYPAVDMEVSEAIMLKNNLLGVKNDQGRDEG